MTEKSCKYCTESKPIVDFNKNPGTKDRLSQGCKKCMANICTAARHRDPERYRKMQRDRAQEKRARFTTWKSTLKCVVCSENDVVALDFHHLDPLQKDVTIARVTDTWSWERLQREIAKCIVVCATCHRKIHKHGIEKTKQLNALVAER